MEIDFIATNTTDKLYFQVTESMDLESVRTGELVPLKSGCRMLVRQPQFEIDTLEMLSVIFRVSGMSLTKPFLGVKTVCLLSYRR